MLAFLLNLDTPSNVYLQTTKDQKALHQESNHLIVLL